MPIKPHPTDPDKVVFVSHKPIPSYEELLDAVEKLKARIAVLERALVALEKDYEQVKRDYWKLVEEVRENSGWENSPTYLRRRNETI